MQYVDNMQDNLGNGDLYHEGHGAHQPDVLPAASPVNRAFLPRGSEHFAQAATCGLSRRALVRACTYLENNIGESFLLNDLAKAAGVSRFHFARLFRVSTGESPMRYRLRLRIERAIEMLKGGEHRICEIATILGFSDQSHLSRTFKRVTGVSPNVFMHLPSEVVQDDHHPDGGPWIRGHRTRLISASLPSYQKQHNDSNSSTHVQFHSVAEEHNTHVAPSYISGQNA